MTDEKNNNKVVNPHDVEQAISKETGGYVIYLYLGTNRTKTTFTRMWNVLGFRRMNWAGKSSMTEAIRFLKV